MLWVWLAACLIWQAWATAGSEPAAQGRTALANDAPRSAQPGRRIPNLVLSDTKGNRIGLADFRNKPVLVLVFVSRNCPHTRAALPTLNERAARYAKAGVQFLAIDADPDDSAVQIAEFAREAKLEFPVLCDPMQTAVDVVGAKATLQAFVLDGRRQLRFAGNASADTTSGQALEAAIDALMNDQPVVAASAEPRGTALERRRRVAPKGEMTYSRQVARILQAKCQVCHHPNTAAPFSLMTYDEAASWAETIREVVLERRMPPWHADPRYGEFREDRQLTQEELDTLVAWVDDGAPQGDPADAPAAREFPDGWKIGQPDAIFELPREVTIPARGTVPYLYFETPTNFKEDVWVQAAEARPGNRRAVHHIVLFYRMPGEERGNLERNWIDGAAPGTVALVLPEGVGRRIPAGAILIWQMHYTATGQEEKDRSQYAFKFCKSRPQREARMRPVANQRFRIPPRAANHEVRSSYTLRQATRIHSFAPHMHLRGKDFEYKAVLPDGSERILLSVPQYDFNWQAAYRLKEPLLLPMGTRIECAAHFDNSAANPANPDPSRSVTWGDQTWEEMMIGYFDSTPE
jgi:peroxiredoxin